MTPRTPPLAPASAPAAPALSIVDLSFAYGAGDPVLSAFNLTAPAGGVTAILGPNGAGKTTLLNLILGWLRPNAGRVEIFGKAVGEMSAAERGRTLSLVPQSEHIPFEYSILDYVLLGRGPYLGALASPGPGDVAIAVEALQRVGLARRGGERVTEISGGELQLVLLARSLCQQPRLLVLDEPSAHLDLSNKRRLANLIAALRSDGVSIILTTHDPHVAAVTADEVVLLADGHCVVQGSPREAVTSEHLSSTFGGSLTVHWVHRHPHIIW